MDQGESVRAVAVAVHGRVQGVSFRAYAEQQAQLLGVRGWVRNEPDGSVAAHLEGDPAAVDAMVAWCRQGPRLAHVERVEVRETEAAGHGSFDIRF
ncbi:acylphosphatase [Nocardioides sp. GCM10027113]|uniref:acylphosphatase n=1 Tax=unclassified Nocardioides TaxID=2615069 RepID=UPI00360F2E90